MAVIDLGSNTFRLVVFRYSPGGPYAMTDEIRETVRLSAGAVDGVLQPDAIARGVAAVAMYAAFCRSTGVDEVIVAATSAIRDAANQADVLAVFAEHGVTARVLSAEEEAFYGYLGIVNSTDIEDGFFLDVGGGSAQIGRVSRRALERCMSAPLGAVRMTETFLTSPRTKRAEIKALRKHVTEVLGEHPWIAAHGLPLTGTGGTVRNLAAMAQRATAYPLSEVHGYPLTREALGELIDAVAAIPVGQRQRIPGLKVDRADIILGGALTIDTVMELLGVAEVEVCGQGLREGLFYERFLAPADPPLVANVRRATVNNVAGNYGVDRVHADHVARLALEIFDGTARAGLHGGDPAEREWLWAAAMLHDIGVIVDYHDHHKHGFYLVMNTGLPGFSHRELAIIAQLVRSHRKSMQAMDWLAPVMREGDAARLERLASCLRLAEQLERDRAQQVRSVTVEVRGKIATLTLHGSADHSVALWSAGQDGAVFERAFGRRLQLTAAGGH